MVLGSWLVGCSVLRPCQHNIGHMGDDFYRSKDSIKVLMENVVLGKKTCFVGKKLSTYYLRRTRPVHNASLF